MDRFYIQGGRPLQGIVRISGSKNSSLAVMAACLLGRGKTILHNVPDIGDIHTMAEMLHRLGAEVELYPDGTLCIDAEHFCATEAPFDLVRKMRASFYVLGPMLARLGAARVPLPGGCDIGARPVDYHTRGLMALGADISIEHGFVEAFANRLHGASIYLDFPSAGATTHLMTAAATVHGTTLIENAAAEPEVVELARFLNAMGAHIEGAGSRTIVIEGVPALHAVEYRIIPDRIEAGTYAVAAAATGGDVRIQNVIPDHLNPVILKLQEAGVDVIPIAASKDSIGALEVRALRPLHAVDILAMPHPGFPTDMQQPFVSLLSTARGTSVITDHVFESRFKYVAELIRMGADIRAEGRSAVVRGVERLQGAAITATDLRAGAAVVVAALSAEGESIISGVEHIDRGYGNLAAKLQLLGAGIERSGTSHPLSLVAAG
ncbi:MAG: UDP-N-acetylglucosamine 1-carboxyvinyltransferase [Armatimonadetes bacterium]|nr:UDP-N-acetylglucosamine 1-carboxyvinyltransferase [Armatimonadota bacterium]